MPAGCQMVTRVQVPTERDINVYNSLDEIWACKNFLGKTVEEAEVMFREHGEAYTEDLMWMGPRAFGYYIRSVINYLTSAHSAGDDFLIDSLASTIEFRLDSDGQGRQLEDTALGSVRELVDYVLENPTKFLDEDDPYPYADVPQRYERLRQRLAESG